MWVTAVHAFVSELRKHIARAPDARRAVGVWLQPRKTRFTHGLSAVRDAPIAEALLAIASHRDGTDVALVTICSDDTTRENTIVKSENYSLTTPA